VTWVGIKKQASNAVSPLSRKCQHCHRNDKPPIGCRAKFQKYKDIPYGLFVAMREGGEG
jgi:hypothetical protein